MELQHAVSLKKYHRRILSWSFYNWADHAYITTTATTFFPLCVVAIAAPTFMKTNAGAIDDAAKALALGRRQIYSLSLSHASHRISPRLDHRNLSRFERPAMHSRAHNDRLWNGRHP